MSKPIKQLDLSDEEYGYLQEQIVKGTTEVRVYKRAKMLLLKAEGISFNRIAEKLDVSIPTVRLCIEKYLESGVEAALKDAPGRGRKQEIFDDSKAWVVNIACQKPTAFGLSAELWYPALLTRYINSVAAEQGYPRMATVSESSIRKILREAQLNPH